MPALQCQECGKELLPTKLASSNDPCICSDCGRNVYARARTKVEVKCQKCGKDNTITYTV